MVKTVRPVRSELVALSDTALAVLHILEPLVGRILATGILKYCCGAIQVELMELSRGHLSRLAAPLAVSFRSLDRHPDVERVQQAIAALADAQEQEHG